MHKMGSASSRRTGCDCPTGVIGHVRRNHCWCSLVKAHVHILWGERHGIVGVGGAHESLEC